MSSVPVSDKDLESMIFGRQKDDQLALLGVSRILLTPLCSAILPLVAVAKNFVRWFTFSVCFALLPIAIVHILHHLGANRGPAPEPGPELIFYSVVVLAAALRDLNDVRESVARDWFIDSLYGLCLLGAVILACVYGSLTNEAVLARDARAVHERYYALGITVAVATTVLSGVVVYFMSASESKNG